LSKSQNTHEPWVVHTSFYAYRVDGKPDLLIHPGVVLMVKKRTHSADASDAGHALGAGRGALVHGAFKDRPSDDERAEFTHDGVECWCNFSALREFAKQPQ